MLQVSPHFPILIVDPAKGERKKVKIRSPFDEHLIATATMATQTDIEQALTTATETFANRREWLSVAKRIEILEKAVQLMTKRADSLAKGSAEEGGKPLIDSVVEMTRCIDSIRLCAETLRHQVAHPVPMGINAASQQKMTMHSKEPIGVVVAVSAFNHPLNLIAHQVGPAIAAGCPVIVKPAEDTPLSCFRLVELLYEAGLPAAWCQAVLPESHEISEALVTDPRVAFFSFIGSAKVGWYLRSKLAPGTRCALEHGGVAPVIVTETADHEKLIPALAKGGFYHAGQVCVSVQRVFVAESMLTDIAEKLAHMAQQLVVGDPLSGQTEVGPLIREAEVERVAQWVEEAIDEGATLLCGGKALSHHCYAPTVLLNPSSKSKVSRAEVFGPVVCLYGYQTIEQAITEANALDVAFQAAVYSQDIDQAMFIADKLAASTVMINEHTAFRVDWMPFAGLRQSGLGTGGIPYTIEDMQVDKMVVLASAGLS